MNTPTSPGAFKRIPSGPALLRAYQAYFKAGQSGNPAECEALLGIRHSQYRKILLSSFWVCIALAILPVWLFSRNLPLLPNWGRVAVAFGYAALWMGVIQPTIDLVLIRALRNKRSRGRA